MVRLRWVFAALLLIPLADALLLVVVAGALGWVPTVALVVLTAFLGMLFVRAEGRHTLRKLQGAVASGREPTNELLDGALLLVAGAFLLTPGLVTDALGFLLAVPPTRYLVRTGLKRYVLAPYADEATGGFVSGNVYTFGFPNGDSDSFGAGGAGPFGGPGGSGGDGSSGSGDAYDLGSDAYEVDFGDEDDGDDSRTPRR